MYTVSNRSFPAVVMILLFIALSACTAAAEIRLGILPRLNKEALYMMFKPLGTYLSAETGEKVSITIPQDYGAFKERVKAGDLDLCFANSIVYIQLRKDIGVELVAGSVEGTGGAKFRGIVIARHDSGIAKLQDLKGKKLVFVDKDAAGGYVFQMLLFKKNGLDINKDFVTLPFAKKHDSVVIEVFNKRADAGGIREEDLEKVKDKVDLKQIRIIGYTDYFPNWPFFAASHMDKKMVAKIRAALLKLKAGDAGADKILTAAKLKGFVAVADKDYDLLRQAASLVGAF